MSYFEESATLPPPFNILPTPKLLLKMLGLRKKDKLRKMKEKVRGCLVVGWYELLTFGNQPCCYILFFSGFFKIASNGPNKLRAGGKRHACPWQLQYHLELYVKVPRGTDTAPVTVRYIVDKYCLAAEIGNMAIGTSLDKRMHEERYCYYIIFNPLSSHWANVAEYDVFSVEIPSSRTFNRLMMLLL